MAVKVADLFARLGFKVDKKSVSGADRAINGVKSKLKGLAVLAGGILLGGAIKETLAFEEGLVRLDIAANGGLGTFEELSTKILDISASTGVAKEQILAGAHAFIALTGDADATAKSLELFTKINLATGATMDDIAASAAAMQQNLGIDPADFERGFNILIAGGKAGKIELRDMASRLAELSPLAEQFSGGGGTAGLAKLGAAFQLTAQGFGTAKQASTGLKALFTSLKRNAKLLKGKGIQVLDKDDNLRAFEDIIADIKKKGLDATEITKLLGSVEAEQTFTQLTKVGGAWDELADKTANANDLAEDYAKINKSASIQIKKAWNSIKVFIARALLFLGKHWEITRVALGAVVAAFVAVKLAAVASAVAAAAAWIVALAPFILIAAVIAAVGFALWDLYNLFTGRGSALKEVFTDAIEFWREKFSAFFDWIAEKFRETLDFVLSVLAVSDGSARVQKVAGVQQIFSTAVAEGKARRNADVVTAPAGNSNNVDAKIEVNMGSESDPQVVGTAMKKAWGDFWDGKMRDSAVETGG